MALAAPRRTDSMKVGFRLQKETCFLMSDPFIELHILSGDAPSESMACSVPTAENFDKASHWIPEEPWMIKANKMTKFDVHILMRLVFLLLLFNIFSSFYIFSSFNSQNTVYKK